MPVVSQLLAALLFFLYWCASLLRPLPAEVSRSCLQNSQNLFPRMPSAVLLQAGMHEGCLDVDHCTVEYNE